MKTFGGNIFFFFIIAACFINGNAIDVKAQQNVYHDKFNYTYHFFQDYYLKGEASNFNEYFYVGEWKISDAVVTLDMSTSELLKNRLSTVNIFINGVVIYEQKVLFEEDNRKIITISIPKSLLVPNQLNTITASVRLKNENGQNCSDYNSPSVWVNIYKESNVSINYMPIGKCDTIAEFYKKFISIEALDNHLSAVCIGNAATETEFTAAANILAQLSSNALTQYQNIGLRKVKNIDDFDENLYSIYICEYKNILPEIKNLMSEEEKQQAQKDAAILLYTLNDKKILLVTGSNDKKISLASKLFGNKKYIETIEENFKYIQSTDNFDVEGEEIKQYELLTEEGTLLKGCLSQSASFTVKLPSNRSLTSSSCLSLDFQYSDKINFKESLVTVFANNIPIGSKKLTKDGTGGSTQLFYFPDDIKISDNLTLKVEFYLYTDENWCKLEEQEFPWAYIENTSMLKMISNDQTEFAFENYPNPFVRDHTINHLLIVIPDDIKESELEAFKSITLLLGRYVNNNRGTFQVSFSSNRGNMKDDNIIAIGNAENNQIIKENESMLYFQYDKDTKNFVSAEGFHVPDDPTGFGIVQLMYSPYSQTSHGLMIITSENDTGIQNAARYLSIYSDLWKVKGNVFIAADEDISCYYIKDFDKAIVKPAEEELVGDKNNRFLVLIYTTGILLLIAVTMLFGKYRKS